MKKEAVLIISILLISIISISFVSAGLEDIWNKITGKIVENETSEDVGNDIGDNGGENGIEQCPTIIGWRIEDNECISDTGCDYDSLKYTYYDFLFNRQG